jgi:hypothetical protein
MVHQAGKTNSQADALSRLPQHKVSDADDNQQQIVLPPSVFMKLAATHFFQNPLEERIRNSSTKEAEVLAGLEQLKKHGLRRLANGLAEWEEENGLIYYRGRVYVPDEENLRRDMVEQCHDHWTVGHPGNHETLNKVDSQFWWPNMRAFVKKYVEGCEKCHRLKHQQHPRALTQLLPTPKGPWKIVGVDFVTQLPEAHGYDAIVTFSDHYTKRAHTLPTTSNVTAEGTIDLYYKEIFRLHGLPEAFVSDRGPQFAAKLMRTLLKRLGIQSNLTTAYHPQANGQTERTNQETEKFLRFYTSRRQDDWDEHLPMAEFALNSRVHSAHGRTPFEADHGYTPLFNIPVGRETGILTVDERMDLLQEVRKDVDAALTLEKRHRKERYESGKDKPHTFEKGDYVFLDARNINIKVPTRKLAEVNLGPFKIAEKIGELDYRLILPRSMKRLHPIFHVDKLSPWKGNEINGIRPSPPPPIVLDDQEEWEVREILNSRLKEYKVPQKGKGRKSKKITVLEYQVSWKDFDDSEDSWEPAENLENAPQLVEEFHRRHPLAPAL